MKKQNVVVKKVNNAWNLFHEKNKKNNEAFNDPGNERPFRICSKFRGYMWIRLDAIGAMEMANNVGVDNRYICYIWFVYLRKSLTIRFVQYDK